HGKLRYLQGYTPAMLVDESRILEVTVFGMLQSNLHSLDFSLLLPDVTASRPQRHRRASRLLPSSPICTPARLSSLVPKRSFAAAAGRSPKFSNESHPRRPQ